MNIRNLKNIHFQKRTHCLICEAKLKDPLIALPRFPLTEIFTRTKIKEKVGFADQNFYFCQRCGHGQLGHVLDVRLQYDSTSFYYYRTSESVTGSKTVSFFLDFFYRIAGKRHFKTIIEIGCNDLFLLKSLQSRALRLIGIDPILKGKEKECSYGKITAIGDFFENVTLNAHPDVVICKDTLEHVSEPGSFLKKVLDIAHPETLFLFQLPLLETLLMGCRFDQVFHQHLNYFSLRSLLYMLKTLRCQLIAYTIDYNHWGEVLIAFRKGTNASNCAKKFWHIKTDDILKQFDLFKKNMGVTAKRLAFLRNETLYGYGAALMLPVLDYHLSGALSYLQCIIDDDEKKRGLYYINLPLRIRTLEEVPDIANSVVVITAIASLENLRSIASKLFQLKPKQIIIPLNTI